MILDKKSARKRWENPAFQEEMRSVVLALTKTPIVISGADLAGITIGKTGPIEEIWNINLYRGKLEDVNLRFADLACSINEADLKKVCLSDSDLDRCLIRNARVIGSDFANSKMVVNMDDSVFESCNFSGASFLAGKAGSEYGGRRVRFIDCDFSGALLKGVEFRATSFIRCGFDNAKFVGCDLRGVKVLDCTLPNVAQFEKMDAPPWARNV